MHHLQPLRSFILSIVAEAADRAPHQVGMHDRLTEDLRIESLEMASVLVQIENAYGIALDASTVQAIQTVQHLEAAVATRMAAHG